MSTQIALPLCQRWRRRRDSYRPAGEPIDPTRYGVEPVTEAEARAFVVAHHYSGSYPAARARVGLRRVRPGGGTELVGVAVFSVPAGPAVLGRWLPHLEDHAHGVELGRLVLLDDVPANGETWFLARAFAVLRQELPEVRAVLSFSDPVERADIGGRRVKPGHVGTVYQALSGRHLGRATPRSCWLDAEGLVVSERALSKIRTGDRGSAYAYEDLRRRGAPPILPGEAGPAYVRRALAEGPFRRLRHPGALAYAWPIGDRREGARFARAVAPALPYPKAPEALVTSARPAVPRG